MSNLLINEPPLLVLPRLAKAIGLNEAIIVQQLHYWLENPKVGVTRDGFKWVFNTYDEWRENFPFWSIPTIQRTFISLEKRGIVISAQLDAKKHDQKKYYRINYDKLCAMEDINLMSSKSAKRYDVKGTTEITSETTKEIGTDVPAPVFSESDTSNTLKNQDLTGSKDGVELRPEKMPAAPKPAATKKEKAEGKAAASAKDFPAVLMYRRIIGRYPNRLSWQTVTNAVNAVSERLGRPATINDLSPFAVAWSDKYGNSVSVNLAWLTEWAVKGEIPAHAHPQKPKYNQSPDSGILPRSIR